MFSAPLETPLTGEQSYVPSRAAMKTYLTHTWRLMKTAKINYCLGVMACFVVVFVVSLLVSVIANAPVIFLRLAELQEGEIDMSLKAGPWTGQAYMNYSAVAAQLNGARNSDRSEADPPFSFHAPRWEVNVALQSGAACLSSNLDLDDVSFWAYVGCEDGDDDARDSGNCFPAVCKATANTAPSSPNQDRGETVASAGSWVSSKLYAIDFEREKRMELGRNWVLESPGTGNIYVQKNVADKAGVGKGSVVFLRISAEETWPALWNAAFNTENRASWTGSALALRQGVSPFRGDETAAMRAGNVTGSAAVAYEYGMSIIYVPFTVAGTFDAGDGKWSVNEREALVIDYGTMFEYIGRFLHPELPAGDAYRFRNLDAQQYAQVVSVNLPPPRTSVYINSNYDELLRGATAWGSEVGYIVGFSRVFTPMRLLDRLQVTQFVSLGLGVILNVVIVVLLFLSVLLIYSLLMINVDTRTFEMAVFRMLGQQRQGVIHMLLCQAVSYAIPAWILGLVFAQIAGLILARVFGDYTQIELNPWLTPTAVLAASVLGLCVPMIAAVLPIRSALGKSLVVSLDVRRSAAPAVKIDVTRSERTSVSWPLLVTGTLLTFFGFGIYYVMPLSLLSLNLALLLNLFVAVLVGMLLGLVLLSLNVSYGLERLVLMLFFFWDSDAVTTVAIKNMGGHRPRNRKTAVLYSMSLAFIVFVSTAYNTQIDAFVTSTEQKYACDIRVTARGSASLGKASNYLDFALPLHPAVRGYTYHTTDMRDTNFWFERTDVGPPGGQDYDLMGIYAVPPRYFAATDRRYMDAEKFGKEPMLAERLYTKDGDKSMLMGARYKENHNVRHGEREAIRFRINGTDSYTQLRVLDFLSIAPGFVMSPFRSRTQDVVMSAPTYMRLLRQALPDSTSFQSLEDIPWQRLLVTLHDNATELQVAEVTSLLNQGAQRAGLANVEAMLDELEPVETVNTIMTYFFSLTTVVAMVVAFFSLMSSMYANVREQTKEIGILRALGLTNGQMYRVYMYEAFTLVFASSVNGMAIGTAVGYTMVLQQVLFTQRPLRFHFDAMLLLFVFLSSVLGAVVASLGPVRYVLGRSVVAILRLAE